MYSPGGHDPGELDPEADSLVEEEEDIVEMH